MKVQCEQCGAGYQVADEKVTGRKLKQRCRKCGAQMLIDGTALAQDVTPMAMPAAAPDEAVWHIAVGDTTQGPYTLEELAQYYADGSVVLDTLVCRDGWSDWRPAGEVPELLHASRGPALVSLPPPAPPPAFGIPPQALGQAVTMGRDPFADGADAGPRVSIEEMATPGAQRDGTVQFSMDQIRALSSVSVTPSLAPPPPGAAGHAGGDGSGLIDMKALAEAEAKAASEAAHAALAPAAPSSAFKPLRPSELGPLQGLSPLTLVAAQKPGLDFRTKVMASVAAFAVVAAAAVAIVVVLRDGEQVAAASPVMPVMAAAALPLAATAPALPMPSAALAAAVTPSTAHDDGASAEADDDDERGAGESHRRGKRGSRRERGGDGGGSGGASRGSDLDDVLAAAPAPKKSSGSSSIDDLLEGAINGKRSAPKPEPAEAPSSLPQTPSKDQMLGAFGRAKAKVASCKGSGVATTLIVIAGKSGKATSVKVSGIDGAAKSCVEKAVRSTSFPRFQKDSFQVQFPFKVGG